MWANTSMTAITLCAYMYSFSASVIEKMGGALLIFISSVFIILKGCREEIRSSGKAKVRLGPEMRARFKPHAFSKET